MTRRAWLFGGLVALALGGLGHLVLAVLDHRPCDADDRRCRDIDRLFRIEELLELHPVLQWRQRPYLDVTFEDTRVVTDTRGFRVVEPGRIDRRREGDPTVVAFGASPDFGYGVEAAEAWPAVLHDLFEASGQPARVVNAGEIGYSSLQGARLFDITKRLFRIDVAVFSYVVNDVEQIRFFFPNGLDDRATERPAAPSARLQNALSAFYPFAALRRVAVHYLAGALGAAPARQVLEHAAIRTRPADYEANLRGLVHRARLAGIQPVFLVLPFRLPVPVPDEPSENEALLAAGERSLAAGRLDEALDAAARAVASDPLSGRGWRLEGRAYEGAGRPSEAARAYAEATEHIIHGCVRAARRYNDVMRRVAAETGTPLVDATPLLGGEAANMALYVKGDYVHPNAKGHALIARAVANVVAPLLRHDPLGGRVQEAEQPARVAPGADVVQ